MRFTGTPLSASVFAVPLVEPVVFVAVAVTA
jgi:hypothetical protein